MRRRCHQHPRAAAALDTGLGWISPHGDESAAAAASARVDGFELAQHPGQSAVSCGRHGRASSNSAQVIELCIGSRRSCVNTRSVEPARGFSHLAGRHHHECLERRFVRAGGCSPHPAPGHEGIILGMVAMRSEG